jgi:DNA invertase Pin-like site-specific DNA recombinase
MFAGLYQFERECMLERQKEGIEIAKQKGSYKNVGRKKIKPNDILFETLYKHWKERKIKAKEFMEALNIKRNTFYRRVKEYEKIKNNCPVCGSKLYIQDKEIKCSSSPCTYKEKI